ncbi:NAD(P)-binding protein [Favolaschia claudopus]|uniref:NAD(P)-binding protein n=1 Tax=Favolaschia claudopus TaxID=2862362 RepID=A0AAW0DMN4_9AGAR
MHSGESESSQKVWLITGTSSGFGLCLVKSVLARGDLVIATARDVTKIKHLQEDAENSQNIRLLELDIVSGEAVIRPIIAKAAEFWGRIDVLVNNAGYGAKGLLEETGSSQLRLQYDTNVFGTLDVTNAVLPYMRIRKSGTIVMIGSRTSWRSENPATGLYGSSKAALRVLSETMATELAPFSIRMLIVEPAGFRTNSLSNASFYTGNMISDYDEMREKAMVWYETLNGMIRGDPVKAMEVLTDVVRGEGKAAGRPWPLYLVLGEVGVAGISEKCKNVLKVIDDWRDVSVGLDVDV